MSEQTVHPKLKERDWNNLKTKQIYSNIGSALLTNVLIFPLERLKLIRQTNDILKQNMLPNNENSFSLFWKLYKSQGFFRLFTGSKVMMYRVSFNSFFRSFSYLKFKQFFLPKENKSYSVNLPLNPDLKTLSLLYCPRQAFDRFWGRFMSGFITGVLSTSIIYPFEVLQTKYMLDLTPSYSEPKFTGVYNIISKVSLIEKSKSFYRGFSTAILLIGPQLGLSFAFFEGIESLISQGTIKEMSGLWKVLVFMGIGTASGTLAQIATYPLETIKRQQQASGVLVSKNPWQLSLSKTAANIWERKGIRGFYGGLGVHCFKAAPAAWIQFGSYHLMRSYAEAY